MRLPIAKFTTLMTMVSSSSAFACPDLSGNYVCKKNGASVNLSVQQENVGGKTIFTLHEDESTTRLPSDGTEYPFGDGQTVKGKMRFICEDGVLRSYLSGERMDVKSKSVESWELVSSMTLDAQGHFLNSTTGFLTRGPQKLEVQRNYTCQRVGR